MSTSLHITMRINTLLQKMALIRPPKEAGTLKKTGEKKKLEATFKPSVQPSTSNCPVKNRLSMKPFRVVIKLTCENMMET